MLVNEGLAVSVDRAGMSARACVNFAERLVDETMVSELMVRRVFHGTEEIGPDDGYFLGSVSNVCA